MPYVYLIKSLKYPNKIYAGYTEKIEQRLETHNSGGSVHTANSRPWELILYIYFQEKGKALEFEHYLKSHAGRAFAAKRFW